MKVKLRLYTAYGKFETNTEIFIGSKKSLTVFLPMSRTSSVDEFDFKFSGIMLPRSNYPLHVFTCCEDSINETKDDFVEIKAILVDSGWSYQSDDEEVTDSRTPCIPSNELIPRRSM